MATALPERPTREAPPGADAAELAWRAVVEADAADLDEARRLWPDRTSPESLALQERIRRRMAPDGEAERAVRAIHRAYGGAARVPQRVRDRMLRYVEEFLGGRPWPERDPSEALNEPAVVRKARRRRAREGPS